MGNKALAPGYIRLTYSGVLFPHHAVLPVNFNAVPEVGEEPTLKNKGGTGQLASEALDDYLALYKVFFHSTTKFGNSEVHTVDPETGEDTFIYAWNAGVVGTNSGANIPMGEFVMTLKDTNGFLSKVYGMEGALAVNAKYLPPYDSITPLNDLEDYLCGDSGWVYGRHNTYPQFSISVITKINDALRKQQGNA